MYGMSGIRPPAMYAPAMVTALRSARLGSGASRPSSKRIMKSTYAAGRWLRAATIGCASAAVRPYDCRMSETSFFSAAGFVRISSSSRLRSLAKCSASLRAAM